MRPGPYLDDRNPSRVAKVELQVWSDGAFRKFIKSEDVV